LKEVKTFDEDYKIFILSLLQAMGEASSLPKRTSRISNMRFSSLFYILWVILAIHDPDLDGESGSASMGSIESMDPDPKH
jgi:hypothetical protein